MSNNTFDRKNYSTSTINTLETMSSYFANMFYYYLYDELFN